MPDISDYITEQLRGKCFRHKDSDLEIVQLGEFIPANHTSDNRAKIKVWYPLDNQEGYLDSSVFDNYVPCSATEIEKIRRQQEDSAQTPPRVLDFKTAKAIQERTERKELCEQIAHLADHLFPKSGC